MKTILTIFLLFLALTLTIKAQPTQGLVAYYPFNGNANDESGNGYNGDAHGVISATDRFGENGKAFSFSFPSWVDCGDILDEVFTTNNYSISVWYKRNTDDPRGTIINKWYSCCDEPINNAFYMVTGSFCTKDPIFTCTDWMNAEIDNWAHDVIVINNGMLQVFRNGVIVATATGHGSQTSDKPLMIGATYLPLISPQYQFRGIIDDIRIYNYALSDSEIQELYNEVPINEEFFDDFSYVSTDEAESEYWRISRAPYEPYFSKDFISFMGDNQMPGNKIMRLKSSIRNTIESKLQSLIQTKLLKFKEGTYAARIKFQNGDWDIRDGNIQSFYMINGVPWQCNPLYSELDFEYLPYDVWSGDDHSTKLWTTSYTTVCDPTRINKTDAYTSNELNNHWYIYIVNVTNGYSVKYYIEGNQIAEQAFADPPYTSEGVYPDERMQIAFGNGFTGDPPDFINRNRKYEFYVDWVYHIKNESVNYIEILNRVYEFKAQRITKLDNVTTTPLLPKQNQSFSDPSQTVIPSKFILSQNYPNPFNPSTSIQYAVPENQFVSLKVYDLLGKEVATLVNEEQQAGYYSIDFNSSNLATGMYIYKIQAGNFIETKKMILLK